MKQSGAIPSIVESRLPEPDLFAGKCFTQRETRFTVDTLIIHSCWVPDEVRNANRVLFNGQVASEAIAIELGKKWRETGKQEFEHAALLALLEGRFGVSGTDKYNVEGIKSMFEFYGVSAHYLIDRSGKVLELIAPDLLAFHAGKSRLPSDGRESVNQFSIGVELLASPTAGFTPEQMLHLATLTNYLMQRYPIDTIYGHSDIAPDRKSDPWGFDWRSFSKSLLRVPRFYPAL